MASATGSRFRQQLRSKSADRNSAGRGQSSSDKGIRGWFRRHIFLIVVVSLIGAVAWFIFGDDGLAESWALHQTVSAAHQRCDSLVEESSILSGRIAALRNNDDFAVEFAARELGMIKPGEKVYKTVNVDDKGK